MCRWKMKGKPEKVSPMIRRLGTSIRRNWPMKGSRNVVRLS